MVPSDSPSPEDFHGLLDGRYEIVRELGEGGMGRVFEGRHLVLRRPVAIKVLSARFASDRRSRKRLLREARAAAAIRHPNVAETIDFGETAQGAVFLVMELLRGYNLRGVVKQQGALPWPRVRNILRQAASALQAAHDQGIIHRDIKPHNCFVEEVEDDEIVESVKVLDFGIAKVQDPGASSTGELTGVGELVGTATYMAPELVFGAAASATSDVYALGIMGYELLTGAPPYVEENPYDVLRCHIEQAPVPPRKRVAEIPAAMEAVVLRAMAKKPEERFASMAAMEAALIAIPAPPLRRQAAPRPPAPDLASGPTGTEVMLVDSAKDAASVDGQTDIMTEIFAGAPFAHAPRPASLPPPQMTARPVVVPDRRSGVAVGWIVTLVIGIAGALAAVAWLLVA